MHYYEIWFYYYGENDSRTDFENEYTFYIKTDFEITSTEQLKEHLKKEFPISDEFSESMHYIPERDYEHLSKWFAIDQQEFTNSCGVPA
jgi:hypothetical protein